MELKDIMVVGLQLPNGSFKWLDDAWFARMMTTETPSSYGLLSSSGVRAMGYVSVYTLLLDGDLCDRDGDSISSYNHITQHLVEAWATAAWDDPERQISTGENVLFFARADTLPVEVLADIFIRAKPTDFDSVVSVRRAAEDVNEAPTPGKRQPWLL